MRDDLPERSAAWPAEGTRPEDETIDRAVAATLDHPLAQQARSHFWCHAVVMRELKSFLASSRSSEIQAALRLLGDSEHVVIVSYHTSDSRPEPLAGHGSTFDFVLHPDTFTVLGAAIGTWRS